MPKRLIFPHFLAVLLATLLAAPFSLAAQEDQPPGAKVGEARWYRSNSSGLALEYIPSRLAAIRNEYCLSVEAKDRWSLPVILLPYYEYPFQAELRTLYEKGEENRRQWILRDSGGAVRLTASGTIAFFSDFPVEDDAEKKSGFIEIVGSDGAVAKEIRFEEDSTEWEFLFFYSGNTLTRAEISFAEAGGDSPDPVPVSTDYYRYTRAGSLRAIDRVLHEGSGAAARIAFPRLGPDIPYEEGLSIRGSGYNAAFLSGIASREGVSISYTLDNRGRILSEVWKDDDGALVCEYRNVWSDDRLQTIFWKSPDDERRVEYEYDDGGNRIAERNYRQELLERSVSMMGDRDVEEIYLDGIIILRAYWENGLKISEERIPSAGSPQGAPAR